MSSCFGDGKFFAPGFRFHPTDEELVIYYLKRKICGQRHRLDVIRETDVYKWDPEELPEISILKTGDRQWFFFSPRERRYPNAARSNRATKHGYWKATGKDRTITCNSRAVGLKKTLVFYKGRAPSGERTDWVMHEYTMDEGELQRCPAKDYYALCKVFKKSGPGPKNGEDYGAPFKEEDWTDEVEANGLVDNCDSVGHVAEPVPVDDNRINCQAGSQIYDLEEFMNRIADDPPLVDDLAYTLGEFVGEDEAQSNVVDQLNENLPKQSIMHPLPCSQYNGQASFDLTQSGASQLQLTEVSEVTSASNINAPEPDVADGDLFEDFLEMDDLLGPGPTFDNSYKPVEANGNPPLNDELDGLSEFDLYNYAPVFLSDVEPGGQIWHTYVNDIVNTGTDPVSNLYFDNFQTGTINYQELNLSNENKVNHQQLERSSVFTPAEAHQGTIPSAVPGDVSSVHHHTGGDQNDAVRQEDGTGSWFSSSLWSFVESIPTTPASASENALVNRAFERMSSFSRVRVNNATNMNVAGGNASATSRSLSKFRAGFFCFSLLGVMCAVLWMLIGTSMRVLGISIS